MLLNDSLLFSPQGYVIGARFSERNWIQPLGFDKDGRIRGGIPVCFPFGKNGYELHTYDSSMKKVGKHGPFRNLLVKNFTLHNPSEISLEQEFNFSERHVQIIKMVQYYCSFADGFEHNVDIISSERNTLLEYPVFKSNLGLHPYFICPDRSEDTEVTITGTNGQKIFCNEFDLLVGKQFPLQSTDEQVIRIGIDCLGTITMVTKGFSALQIWSDSESYICVEPVEIDWRDYRTEGKGALLLPGTKRRFSCRYSFQVEV